MRTLSANKLKAFQLAGLTGSFKHAAHLLAITPSAVSARVRSLERDLGIRLFTRGTRRLSLTEAGLEYIREVESLFANLEVATRELRARFAVAGVAPRASGYLAPRALQIQARGPLVSDGRPRRE
jgi:LysR family glycine cleavage system transcriptional activator